MFDDLTGTEEQSFFEKTKEGVCFHKIVSDKNNIPIDYIITYLNPASENILRLKKEDVLGQKASKVYGLEKPPYLDIYSKVAQTGEPVSFETYFPPMKKYFHISVSSYQKGTFNTFFLDITRIKELEKETLRQKEEKDLLLDTIDIQIWYMSDPFTYAAANNAHAAFIGLEKTDLKNKKINELFPPEVADICIKGNEKVFRSAISVKTTEMVTGPSREPHLLSITKTPDMDEKGNVRSVICSAQDITAETKLKELMELQRDLALNMSQATSTNDALKILLDAVLDIDHIDSGGVYLANKRTDNLDLIVHKGLSRDFIKKSSHYEKDSPQMELLLKGKPLYKDYNSLIDMTGQTTTKKRLEGLKGTAIIPIMYHDKLMAALNIASHTYDSIPEYSRNTLETIASMTGNILENTRMNDKIKKQREDLINFYDSLNDFIFILGTDGNIINTNRTVEEKLGYTKEELGSMSLLQVHPADKREEALVVLQDMLKGKTNSCTIPLITRYGSVIPVETKITCGTWNDENVIFGISRDISEQKKYEQMILEAKDAAEDANRSKSSFLANMSHELRTPLNSIIGFSDMLNKEIFGPLNDKQRHYVNNVSKGGKHLLTLINDILDLSKVESNKMEMFYESFDISRAFDDVKLTLEPLALKKSINLTLDVDPSLKNITADRMKFKQILYNLLSNAIKFTPDNGKVDIKTHSHDGQLEVSISDTGIGIPEDRFDELFQPFNQLHQFNTKKYEGTGLGLVLTQKFIHMHGGQIEVESTPGEGTTFSFSLPMGHDADV